MTLPLAPPLHPMLARLAPDLPEGEEWVYEPKWDGFRALVFRDGADLDVRSRDDKALLRYFPELAPLLLSSLPDKCIVDGEVVVAADGGLEFDLLSQRIHPAASRIAHLAETTPASMIAFDLLAFGDDDLTDRAFAERAARLVELGPRAADPGAALDALASAPVFFVTASTADPDAARAWLTAFEDRGLDGVVAKRLDRIYLPGKRDMVKVKVRRTVDCVVGGYRVAKDGKGVGSLLLGLYDDAGVLHYVGHTSGFKAAARIETRARLRPLEGESGFGEGRTPGGPSRWTGGRDPSWIPLRPEVVVEVSYDRFLNGRFRHAAGFVRWRDDKPPEACTFDQV